MNTVDKAKAVSYTDIVLLILGMLLVGIFGLIFAFEYNPDATKGSEMRLLFVGVQIRFVIAGIIQLALIFLLLEGVMLRSHKRCSLWVLVSKVFVGLMTLSAVVKLFMDPISVFLELIGIAYKIYSIRLVGAYGLELQNDSVFHP